MDNVKRPWYIIRMFSRVLSVYPDASLLMLGGGELLPEMRKLAKSMGMEKNIHFLGNVENVDDYLDISSVFVLSSASESFGCSAVEAMRCGVPIVTNDCPGGLKEILRNKCGIITPYLTGSQYGADDELSKEEIEMADAVIRILSEKSLYNQLSEACKEGARRFHLNRIGLRWEKEVVDGKNKNMNKKKLAVAMLCGISGLYTGMAALGQLREGNKQLSTAAPDKFADYFSVLDQWMCLKEEGKRLESYFIDKGY